MSRLDEIIETFASVDDELRLEILLDYARKLPPLPAELAAERDLGDHRVPECMTPVHLWILPENGHVRIHADVAEEAPTVQGFLSIIIDAYDGGTRDALVEMPADLLNRLGLGRQVRMNRAVGLNAIIQRIKREAARTLTGS